MAPTAVLDPQGRPSKRPKLATKSAQSKVHSDDDSLSDGMLEKDETELRLEKLLFGDEEGFLDSLRTESRSQTRALVADPGQKSDVDTDEEDLDEVADEDLFFLDSGTGALPSALNHESENGQRLPSPASRLAWYDSDDDRIRVSLASNTRLRKLRDTEADDVVTGRDYIRRLRRQYERLHPTPEWAKYAEGKKMQKRVEKLDGEDSDKSGDSDISMDDESSIPSVQPLADLLRSGGALIRTGETMPGNKKRRRLRSEVIDIQRTKDVAGQGPSSIDTLQFHPRYPLLLSAGPSSTMQLHHVSPQPPNPNPLLTSLHVKGAPIHTAAFCAPLEPMQNMANTAGAESKDNTQIFFASRRRYFHTWSLSTGNVTKVSRPMYGSSRAEQRTMEAFKLSPCGQFMALVGSSRKGGGSVNVLTTESMQWICSCRIDSQGGIADFAWWRNSQGLTIVGKNGEVTEYDLKSKRAVARWLDEGAVGTTVISLGGDLGKDHLGRDRWVAVGSSSGIVNIYDRLDWKPTKKADGDTDLVPRAPKPVRVLDQLTTPISHLMFSHDGQMLVMASRWKKNALRLIHLPSCTVYRNWPTDKTPLGRVSSVALSLDGGLLAVGNEQGKIRLWEIRD